jgi:prepilin-type N-terminal cleavage/methylation domain-containing protein
MSKHFQNQAGFTLIEMLIVIIILGILAVIIIPQITVSTEEARVNTLKTNLSGLRSSIEVYYAQHGSKYPGDGVPDTKPTGITTTAHSFVAQLTRYTDKDGNISNSKDGTYKYGPYVKGGGDLPANPYDPDEDNDVTVDDTTTDITTRTHDGTTAWKFYAKTGVLIANDNSEHAAY